jgi:hypothetical protein
MSFSSYPGRNIPRMEYLRGGYIPSVQGYVLTQGYSNRTIGDAAAAVGDAAAAVDDAAAVGDAVSAVNDVHSPLSCSVAVGTLPASYVSTGTAALAVSAGSLKRMHRLYLLCRLRRIHRLNWLEG